MVWRKSFIMRIFLILLVCLVLLFVISGIGIYYASKNTVGTEIIRMNQAALNQLAEEIGGSLGEAIDFCGRVAVNNRILQLAKQFGREAEKEAHTILAMLQGEFNGSHTNGASLTEVYVLGSGGLQASSYNSEHYSWESIANDPRCAPLMDGSADYLILPVQHSPNAKGVMTYSFQILTVMRDLLDGAPLGFVVVDTSELLLYRQYSSYERENAAITIMDSQGLVQSAKDKRQIGFYDSVYRQLQNGAQLPQDIAEGVLKLSARIPASDWVLVEQLDVQAVFGTLGDVRNSILAAVTVCTLLALTAVIVLSRKLLKRVSHIQAGMEKMTRDDLSVRLTVERDDEFGVIEDSFNSMVQEIDRLIETVRRTEQEKRAAEMDFLHAQINTHFIHNTLTSIRFMMEMGQVKEAGEMLFYFSKLLRQTLTRSSEFIPLRQELDTLQSYVRLQWYRYQNSFDAAYDVDEAVLGQQVPALILQPVVENAIFHGVGQQFTHIKISARSQDGNLVLTVEDDGVGMPEEVRDSILKKDVPLNHVGLRNVHDRIRLCYGEPYGVGIDSQMGSGTRITFTLPLDRQKGGICP